MEIKSFPTVIIPKFLLFISLVCYDIVRKRERERENVNLFSGLFKNE